MNKIRTSDTDYYGILFVFKKKVRKKDFFLKKLVLLFVFLYFCKL